MAISISPHQAGRSQPREANRIAILATLSLNSKTQLESCLASLVVREFLAPVMLEGHHRRRIDWKRPLSTGPTHDPVAIRHSRWPFHLRLSGALMLGAVPGLRVVDPPQPSRDAVLHFPQVLETPNLICKLAAQTGAPLTPDATLVE